MELFFKTSIAFFCLLSLSKCQDPRILKPTESPQASVPLMEFPPLPDRPSTSCSPTVIAKRLTAKNVGQTLGVEPTIDLGSALVVFLCVGVFAALIAATFQAVRRYVYHDANNLDTTFDAGGKVSIGLTATTIVSQWTWAATLLQSCTVATRYGLSGPYWYAAGASIQIIVFSILSIMLKTRAPGAKTFLQVMKARYGKQTHLVFCVFALFTNIIVTLSLMLGGVAVLNSLVDGLSPELASMVLALVIGSYTMIGGLGATFYVSYFNTALIFILIIVLVVEVFYNPYSNEANPFGSSSDLHQYISCIHAPEGNRDGSYITFYSSGGLIFGIVNIVGNFGAVFCDQAYWQSSVAAKPIQGVWGFIAGGLTWFSIPFTLATTMGLAYLGLSSAQDAQLLSLEDIAKGLSAPVVAQKLLGTTGEYLIILLILMAVMSTGSAEVIAVASVMIYDVYATYIFPFRTPWLTPNHCILCCKPLRQRVGGTLELELCSCPRIDKCEGCTDDAKARSKSTSAVKPHYKCPVHAEYKEYQRMLAVYKNWCVVIITLLTIPLNLFGWAIKLNLAWTYYFMGVLVSSAVVPVTLSITWARASATALVSGAIMGNVCAIVSWLGLASSYEGGLSFATFIRNTGEDMPMLLGNLVAIGVGGLVSIWVTLSTRPRQTEAQVEAVWEKTRDIDNPLYPWVDVYKGELDLEDAGFFHDRPPMKLVISKFRNARLTAYSAAGAFVLLFVFIWPGAMLAEDELGESGFLAWTTISRGWAWIAAAFIITVPLVQEVIAIQRQLTKNKTENKIQSDIPM